MRWRAADSVEWLRGTPINCLITDAPPGRAGSLGLATVKLGPQGVAEGTLTEAPWRKEGPVYAIRDVAWPQVRASKDQATGGPTGLPWIDSAGWMLRMARALAPQKSAWVVAQPPKDEPPGRAEDYLLAVADAAAHGGRWVIDLDDKLRAGLAAGAPEAVKTWRRIGAAVALFEAHKEWRSLPPLGVLGVVSDFSSANEFMATEALNLLARRQLGYRVLEKSKVETAGLEGLKAILYVDQEAPTAGLRRRLASFASQGGLLVLPRVCAPMADGLPAATEAHPRYEVRSLGKGRIAVARADWDDPYAVAMDAHLLLSLRHDLVHVYNTSALNAYCAGAADGSRSVVHLLNYTKRPPSAPVTLAVKQPHRWARMWTLDGTSALPLKSTREGNWFELPLPDFTVYAAIELGA